MTNRVVILGHTGFIGSHLARCIPARQPSSEVIGLSTASVDLTSDGAVDRLGGYFDHSTTVIMCAAIVKGAGDTLDNYLANVKMAVTLSRAINQYPVDRLILLSSAAVYGEDVPNACITEDTPVQPTSYYGMAKCATEWLVRKGVHPGTSLVILRPPTVYGPGERVMAYGPRSFLAAVLERQPVVLWGDGAELREFVFIDDLIEVVARMLSSRCEGVFNVVSGNSYTFVDVLDVVSSLARFRPDVTSRPRTKQKVHHRFSNEALKRELPGMQFTALSEGLRRTYEAEQQARRMRQAAIFGIQA